VPPVQLLVPVLLLQEQVLLLQEREREQQVLLPLRHHRHTPRTREPPRRLT
jgi:hypothetical protein